MSKATKNGDAANTGFDFPENILRHKPGFELGEAARETEADGAVWAGSYVAEVSQQKFEKCTCLGVSGSERPPPCHDVGFRELDNKTYSGVNFIP